MRLPLISGQGNFGSMDGDPPAAMRYTEARLGAVADAHRWPTSTRDTVDFQPNYDETDREPTVPSGVSEPGQRRGIAVGMATNICRTISAS